MKILNLIFKEISHRKTNFVLAVLAVAAAAALYVWFRTAAKASERETARLMLSMGYNLRILPEHTDLSRFFLTGLPDKTMPESYLQKLASQRGFSYNHLLATLQKEITYDGMDVVLTGLAPEICPPGQKRPPMLYQIEPSAAHIGYRIARGGKLNKGDTIELLGKKLTVADCLREQGGIDDIRIQCSLGDVQDMLKLPGRISEIRAVDCFCFAASSEPLRVLREQILFLLPDTIVIQSRAIAGARARQRQMVRNMFAVILPIVVIACGVWIGALAMMNVRDREKEIGIMRALGYGSPGISLLFLGRAVIIGLAGAGLGFLLGSGVALWFGPGIFKITAATTVKPELTSLVWLLIFAPVLAAVAGFIPAMLAVTLDPAVTLRED